MVFMGCALSAPLRFCSFLWVPKSRMCVWKDVLSFINFNPRQVKISDHSYPLCILKKFPNIEKILKITNRIHSRIEITVWIKFFESCTVKFVLERCGYKHSLTQLHQKVFFHHNMPYSLFSMSSFWIRITRIHVWHQYS